MCWERKQKLESWFWMKILLRGALLIWTQIFSHLKSSKKFWSVKNSVFGCNWASTFCYHFKLDYLCCLDEKENGHQLFDFPPIPPSRPGSSPSNGFEMMIYAVWSILFWFLPGSTDQLFLATQHHRGCALPDEHSAWTTWHYMTLFFNTITIIVWLVILGTLHSIQGKRNSHNFVQSQWTRLLSSPLSSAITAFPPSSVI